MRRVMIRYRVKPDQVEENEMLVRAVYDALRETSPDGFKYVTFKLADGVSFMHVSSTEAPDGQTPLPDLPAFQRFLQGIPERCDEQPVVTELHEVGSFGMFD